MNSGTLERRRNLTPLQKRFIKLGLEDINEAEGIRLIFNLCRYSHECDRRINGCIKYFKTISALLAASNEGLHELALVTRVSMPLSFYVNYPVRF